MTRLTDAELAELEIYARKGDVYSRWKDALGFDTLPVTVEIHEFMLHTWFEKARNMSLIPGVDLHLAKLPDLLADLIAAREALRGMTAIFEQMLIHPDDTMYDARFWKQIAREGIAQGGPR